MADGYGSGRDGAGRGRGDSGDEPMERYFRPRPGAATPGDSGEQAIDGVRVEGAAAPRVPVESRGPRRPGPSLSPRAALSARRQRRFLMVTGGVSAFVLLTSGGAWAFQNYVAGAIGKVGVNGLSGSDGPKGAMTILVAGVDRREGLTRAQQRAAHLGHDAGERSDTMMLLHVSRDHDRVSVVNLPRDSYVTIPSHKSNGSEGAKGSFVPSRPGKLTWAYQFGGPDLTVETIKQATNVSIDHYVEVNFYGFVNMVDALGGVQICTEQAIDDPKSGLRLPAGKSKVDGLKALAYARARYTLGDGTDLGRIDRQQAFMAALMKQALSSNTFGDPVKSTRFMNAVLKALRVDKDLAGNLPKLADQMKHLSTDSVTFAKVPLSNPGYNVVMWNASAPQSTVQWDRGAAADLFSRFRHDEPLSGEKEASATPSASASADAPTVAPAEIQVRVLNAVGTRGLAGRAGDDLAGVGFRVTVVPGVARRGLATTLIQYGPGRADSAKTLAAAIPGARLKKVAALGDHVQVLVGKDWDGATKVKVAGAPSAAASPAVQTGTATQKLCK
ncbi:LCP family protein [Actinomadura parmotrematis]|uniref:LCP family protein n=1 Tax=Actinomadura parmotrematis TaxID=2864039 RepID=A0ABS7FYB8_9ACTN|nr:LCP family protein [Actinomadura parmotrematis]MBW8484659.1 LCP family protein [Actinomadura parmotrematis]